MRFLTRKSEIDFMGKRQYAVIISLLVITVAISFIGRQRVEFWY